MKGHSSLDSHGVAFGEGWNVRRKTENRRITKQITCQVVISPVFYTKFASGTR